MEEDWSGYEVVNPAAETETGKPVSLSDLLYETTIMFLNVYAVSFNVFYNNVHMLLNNKSAPELVCVHYMIQSLMCL